jgi:hypothetical protein
LKVSSQTSNAKRSLKVGGVLEESESVKLLATNVKPDGCNQIGEHSASVPKVPNDLSHILRPGLHLGEQCSLPRWYFGGLGGNINRAARRSRDWNLRRRQNRRRGKCRGTRGLMLVRTIFPGALARGKLVADPLSVESNIRVHGFLVSRGISRVPQEPLGTRSLRLNAGKQGRESLDEPIVQVAKDGPKGEVVTRIGR